MEIEKKVDFLTGLTITLGTIIVGLVSYIFYTENTEIFIEPKRCEYNGWAYADKEIYEATDGCNICFCHSGESVCSEKTCTEENTKYCSDGTLCPTPL
ncbi:MAG: hypothetical protein ACOX0X_01805 [Candidatus Dojkabacteria bacterium]|jgi:hypothetical protein